jgi:hypothetical protein
MSRTAVHTRPGGSTSEIAGRVPHCVKCLTRFLDSDHCRGGIATSVCKKGVSWPSRLAGFRPARSRHLAIDRTDSDLREAGQRGAAILS